MIFYLLLMYIYSTFAVEHTVDSDFSKILIDKANGSVETHGLKEIVLTPYVLNIYEGLETLKMDPQRKQDVILIPEAEEYDIIGGEKSIAFDVSDVLSTEMKVAHLVINSLEVFGGGIQVRNGNKSIWAHYMGFGYVTDVTQFINSATMILNVKFNMPAEQIIPVKSVLAVFQNLNHEEIAELESPRNTRKKRSEAERLPIESSSESFNLTDPNICGLKPWTMDFEVLGWRGWLWSPATYEANVCSGFCSHPFVQSHYNATGYAIVKSYFNSATRYQYTNVPRACCTPIEYGAQKIMYLTKRGQVKLINLADMKVLSCGCR